MVENSLPLPEQASKLIQEYLQQHPEVGGIRGLAEKADLSYDSVQKYAKGSTLPPPKKWEILWAAINSPIKENVPSKVSLFDRSMENKSMVTEHSENNIPDTVRDENVHDQIFADLTVEKERWTRAEERQEIFIPVHGFTWFYPEEVKIINHPAFQRLAGMHQLGMTNLVYRGATHRRIEHALGAVGVAQRMLDAVEHNCKKWDRPDSKDQWLLGYPPTAIERRFIRLAALLHDIGHVPYGHTIEDELHLLNKHDGEKRLNRIFNEKTWYSKEIITLAELINNQYKKYIPETLTAKYQASDLLKRIILKPSKDQTEEQRAKEREIERSFAEAGLRMRICRDIVGDTICADLLDYLHRDWYHIGKPRYFDERILHYMEIRTPVSNASVSVTEPPRPTEEDVFVISIGNRPKLRTDGVSAILNLLESRYELAEAVLFHRTKMNATAMLERALSLAIPSSGEAIDLEGWMLKNPEEVLLPAILEGKGPIEASELSGEAKENWKRACDLISRLLRRDLYKLLHMVTYDQFDKANVGNIQKMYGDSEEAPVNRAKALRLLEKQFDLPPGTIVMYCPESRMNSKIAEVQIFVEYIVDRFDKYENEREYELSAGHLGAQLNRFKRLWKIGFFIAPEVAEDKGEEFLSHIREAIRVQVLSDYPRGELVDTLIARIARGVVLIPKSKLYGKKVLSSATPLTLARTDVSVVTDQFPTGARSLLDFIERDGHGNDSADVK